MVVYATADDWFQSVAHDTTRDGETIGACRMPLKDEFTSDVEYEKALSMRDERYKEFQRQFHARPNVREKDNAYHRAEYANMDAEIKKEKMDRDQSNKDARKENALQSGMHWCSFGSHAVPLTSMYGKKMCSKCAQVTFSRLVPTNVSRKGENGGTYACTIGGVGHESVCILSSFAHGESKRQRHYNLSRQQTSSCNKLHSMETNSWKQNRRSRRSLLPTRTLVC
jgi:hypothetical protein